MRYEIKLAGRWLEVRADFFWAWTGHRRINGKSFVGTVLPLGTRKENRPYVFQDWTKSEVVGRRQGVPL